MGCIVYRMQIRMIKSETGMLWYNSIVKINAFSKLWYLCVHELWQPPAFYSIRFAFRHRTYIILERIVYHKQRSNAHTGDNDALNSYEGYFFYTKIIISTQVWARV